MALTKGKKYYYWNQRADDIKPTKKICRLISISNDGKFALVEREDLTVNRIQRVDIRRLKEIPILNDDKRKLF